jgi:hypothetical protein
MREKVLLEWRLSIIRHVASDKMEIIAGMNIAIKLSHAVAL